MNERKRRDLAAQAAANERFAKRNALFANEQRRIGMNQDEGWRRNSPPETRYPPPAAKDELIAADAWTAQSMAGLGARQSSANPTLYANGVSNNGGAASIASANKLGVGA